MCFQERRWYPGSSCSRAAGRNVLRGNFVRLDGVSFTNTAFTQFQNSSTRVQIVNMELSYLTEPLPIHFWSSSPNLSHWTQTQLDEVSKLDLCFFLSVDWLLFFKYVLNLESHKTPQTRDLGCLIKLLVFSYSYMQNLCKCKMTNLLFAKDAVVTFSKTLSDLTNFITLASLGI